MPKDCTAVVRGCNLNNTIDGQNFVKTSQHITQIYEKSVENKYNVNSEHNMQKLQM